MFCCYLEKWGIEDFSELTEKNIRDFILLAQSSNPANMDSVMYALKYLIKNMNENGLNRNAINLSYYSVRRKPHKLMPVFTREEMQKILLQIDRNTLVGKRDYAIILLTITTGLRGGDVTNLKLTDIDWHSNEINIIQLKTRKPLKLPMAEYVGNALADYILNGRPETKFHNIFIRKYAPYAPFSSTAGLDCIIEKYRRKAGLEKEFFRSFHSLRRSIGTWMAEEEVPIYTISQVLGHSSINSSKPYISFNKNQMTTCAMGFEDIPITGGVYL